MDHKRSNSKKKQKRKLKKRDSIRESSLTDSSDSSCSDENSQLLERLEAERKRYLEEKRREKEYRKSIEGPEEKRLRRLIKKELKERKRKERMGWDNDYLNYTNADNPFGDSNLLETFVWKKKLEKLGLDNLDKEELARCSRMKQDENKRELEKVKKRRQMQEAERAMREEEEARLQRQKEAAYFREWEKQEDNFHLHQACLRSKIRIQDGRAKPIDLLAKYISAEDDVDAVEMHEPYIFLSSLTLSDLEDLYEDIKVYKQLEKGKNLEFWNDMTIIVEDELTKLRQHDDLNRSDQVTVRHEGIHASVTKEVSGIFKHKTHQQLIELQKSISDKINNPVEGTDVSYWESVLSQLNAHMARIRLRERHQQSLKTKLQLLRAQQWMQSEESKTIVEQVTKSSQSVDLSTPLNQKIHEETVMPVLPNVLEQNEEDEDNSSDSEADDAIIEKSIQAYENGRYSPELIDPVTLEMGIFTVSEEDDKKHLDFARQQLFGGSHKAENALTAEEKILQLEAKKGMTDDEAVFSVEAPLEQKSYMWSDKYRPRKPRYFNRVHTGFEWNKYNQTHYDMDNPPPKIVQGYKFNIFYPDLIDKDETPQYSLIPCDDKEFANLKFQAGPPYEDIAFKIVNREWEYSYKRGFRCQFQNNIFQLWFHFKRYRYRR